MLQAGADPDKAAQDGSTPLVLATATSNTAVMKLLLLAGANAEKATLANVTPLTIAEQAGKEDLMKILTSAAGTSSCIS